MQITIHYPLPSGNHPGGRLQRKARLRKKQLKYRLAKAYSFKGEAVLQSSHNFDENGDMLCEMSFSFCKNS